METDPQWTEVGTGTYKKLSKYGLKTVIAKNCSRVEDWIIVESWVDDVLLKTGDSYFVMESPMTIAEMMESLPFVTLEPLKRKGHYRAMIGDSSPSLHKPAITFCGMTFKESREYIKMVHDDYRKK